MVDSTAVTLPAGENGIIGGDDGVTLPAGDNGCLSGNGGAYQQSEALARCVDGGI